MTINDETDAGTLFTAKRNHKRVLYAYEESATVNSKFVFYSLPLSNQENLAVTQSLGKTSPLTLLFILSLISYLSVESWLVTRQYI